MKPVKFTINSLNVEFDNYFSVNFHKQLVFFTNAKLEKDFRPYVAQQTLGFRIYGKGLIINREEKFCAYEYVDIGIWGVCGLFDGIKLYWRDKKEEQIVIPTESFEGELEFWFENYPSEEDISFTTDRMKDLWETKIPRLITQKFKFKVREGKTLPMTYPDFYMTLKTQATPQSLEEVITQTIETYNRNSDADESAGKGGFHDWILKDVKKDKVRFFIDAGSAPPEQAVLALLTGLDWSSLKIESINLG